MFEEQQPSFSNLAPLIPAKTAFLFRFGFDKAPDFFKSLYDFQDIEEGFIEDIWDNYEFNIHDFWIFQKDYP